MRRAISSFAALGAVVLMAIPAQASGAGATTFTQTFHNASQVLVSPNPCTGVLGTVTLTYNGVFHVTFLTSGVGAGTGWGTFTGTGAFTVAQVNGVTFTGHFMNWDGFNFNLENFTSTSTFILHGTGSDGSTISFHAVAHITALLTSPPTVVVQFMMESCN